MTDLDAKIAECEARLREAGVFAEGPEPEPVYHFTIEFDCTWYVWESVKLALRGFPLENRHACQHAAERKAR